MFRVIHSELPSVLDLAELEGAVSHGEGETTNGVEKEHDEIPLSGVSGKPVEPEVDWDEEGEGSKSLPEDGGQPVEGIIPVSGEGIEVKEEMDASGVELVTNSLGTGVPGKVPTVIGMGE